MTDDYLAVPCPGCGIDVLIFEDGTALEPREESVDGLSPEADIAFHEHACSGGDLHSDEPPIVLYATVEANKTSEGDDLFVHVGSPYADRDTVERDAERKREAISEANAEAREGGGKAHYTEWTVDVQEIHLSRHQLAKATPMDDERHEIMMDAAAAVGRSLLSDTDDEA